MPPQSASHPMFARFYGRVAPLADRRGLARRRPPLLADLAGEVIEVGAGIGLNFPHYPPSVTRVVAVEPEPRLRLLASQAAARALVKVEVIDGLAERLPVGDASFDAAVACLVLCAVSDHRAALIEMRRVVRPGGELRFFEHVAVDTPGFHRVQTLLDTVMWPALFGGCHLGRDTVAAITDAGFTMSQFDQVSYPGSRMMLPFALHVDGIAHRAVTPARAAAAAGEEEGPC